MQTILHLIITNVGQSVASNGKNAYILSGVEKFVASCLTKIPVAKVVVYTQVKKKNDVPENWFERII